MERPVGGDLLKGLLFFHVYKVHVNEFYLLSQTVSQQPCFY